MFHGGAGHDRYMQNLAWCCCRNGGSSSLSHLVRLVLWWPPFPSAWMEPTAGGEVSRNRV